jgi:hypothetical protein
VTVRDLTLGIAARIDSDFDKFPNNSDSSEYDLVVYNKAPKEDLISGKVTIRIDPVGNDRWTFNFVLVLLFDDGSKLVTEQDGINL